MLWTFILLFEAVSCLQPVINLNPPYVGSQSSMTLAIFFDETIGDHGLIKVTVPPDLSAQQTPENRPLTFSQGNISCSSDSTDIPVESCTSNATDTLDIRLHPDKFVIAGSFVTINIANGTLNPSSLYYLTKSIRVQTFDKDGRMVEEAMSGLASDQL